MILVLLVLLTMLLAGLAGGDFLISSSHNLVYFWGEERNFALLFTLCVSCMNERLDPMTGNISFGGSSTGAGIECCAAPAYSRGAAISPVIAAASHPRMLIPLGQSSRDSKWSTDIRPRLDGFVRDNCTYRFNQKLHLPQ
jgi:hypothetical protein